jgi:hypothetical protein
VIGPQDVPLSPVGNEQYSTIEDGIRAVVRQSDPEGDRLIEALVVEIAVAGGEAPITTCGCRKLIRASDLALRLRTRSSCASRLNAFRNRASNLEHAQLQHTIAGVVSDTAEVTGLAE